MSRFVGQMAPGAGFEPAADRLTADCSTAELPRNMTRCDRFRRPAAAYSKPRIAAPVPRETGRLEARAGIEPACKDLQSSA
jgi:hypothetical protein